MRIRSFLFAVILAVFGQVADPVNAQWTKLGGTPGSRYIKENHVYFDRNNGLFLFSKKLYRTTDGGDSWRAFGQLPGIISEADMRFAAPDIGYLLVDGTRLYKSSDRGATWNELALSDILPDSLKTKRLSLEVFADKSLMLANTDVYISSIDSGLSWRIRPAFKHGAWGFGPAKFGTADYGIVADADWYKEINKQPVILGSVQVTTNGGQNWGYYEWGDDQPNLRFVWAHNIRWLGFSIGSGQVNSIFVDGHEDPVYFGEWNSAPILDQPISDLFDAVFFNGHWIATARKDTSLVLIHSLDNGSSWSGLTQFGLPENNVIYLETSLDSTTLFVLPQYNAINAYRLEQSLGIESTTEELDHARVYPNPALDHIRIDGVKEGERAYVYDALGRAVLTVQIANHGLNVAHLSSGTYSLVTKGIRTTFTKLP